jgi:hypothetical protein
MKNFIITEDEKKSILGKYYSKQIINEQKFLAKFFTGTADDIVKNFGDDVAKSLDDVFAKVYSHSGNIVSKAEGAMIKSLSGAEVPITTIQSLIKLVGEGKIQANQVLNYLPRKLADGTEFRNLMQQAFEKKGVQNIAKQAGQQLSQFESKFLLKNCVNNGYCDVKNILSNFYSKLNNVAKLSNFIPSKVKILEKSNVSGREIINVTLEDGTPILFYKSSGANVASTGKEAGEWFVIPGFAENGWFFKTQETINLTKGGNKYLTDMAEYLTMNGTDLLGK